MSFNPTPLRRHFPILSEKVDGKPLIYLDNAATTQKPKAVLEAETGFYEHSNANINRGVHVLAERATQIYDDARSTVQKFLGARHPYEIIFTRNATEAVNLVAKTWGMQEVYSGDTIVLTMLEHHSNIVPWQQLQAAKGCKIEWLDIDDNGELDVGKLAQILDTQTVKLISVTGLSNVLGVRPPLEEIIAMAHDKGAKVLVDGAQMLAHMPVDVRKLNVDFFVCSAHKVYGPTGIGALYAKADLLEQMPPFLGGGDMIRSVTKEGFTSAELPRKFEAGTPAIAQAAGFAAALNWLSELDRDALEKHEQSLLLHAADSLRTIKGLRILGPLPANRSPLTAPYGCLSFTIEGIHPHDLTEIIGRQGVCLRAGHHCTQPLHAKLGITASTRLSVAAYNTKKEIDVCVEAIEKAITKLV